jgi:hypothetical protein
MWILLPEAEFERVFADNPDVDNSPDRQGKPLNMMTTNRQRCFMLGDNLLQILEQQKDNQISRQLKRKRCGLCGNLKSTDLVWTNCKYKGCPTKYCPNCQEEIAGHKSRCGYAEKSRKEQKKKKVIA